MSDSTCDGGRKVKSIVLDPSPVGFYRRTVLLRRELALFRAARRLARSALLWHGRRGGEEVAQLLQAREVVPGQSTANPRPTFGNHSVVDVGGKIYDPSYGTGTFDNLKAWEDASVAGFAKPDQFSPGNWRVDLRKNLNSVADIEVYQRIAK